MFVSKKRFDEIYEELKYIKDCHFNLIKKYNNLENLFDSGYMPYILADRIPGVASDFRMTTNEAVSLIAEHLKLNLRLVSARVEATLKGGPEKGPD